MCCFLTKMLASSRWLSAPDKFSPDEFQPSGARALSEYLDTHNHNNNSFIFLKQHFLIKAPVLAIAHGTSKIERLIACVMNCSLSNSYLNTFGRQTERDQPLGWAACHRLRLSEKEFSGAGYL
ncbi:uncharacterized [Tachysurus ichikawai]